ncbi:hypothetical protein Y032_0013g1950 [Ancylostoma ceylanicum]|nr:hypothetical protein Y032_0013g1950 [Ancylostoma ceylanicum]
MRLVLLLIVLVMSLAVHGQWYGGGYYPGGGYFPGGGYYPGWNWGGYRRTNSLVGAIDGALIGGLVGALEG